MQDARELASLFEKDSNERRLEVFNDRIFTYITDQNSTANMLMFDNQSTMNGLYSMDDAYIELPLTISGIPSTFDLNGVDGDKLNLALRNSTAELISGIQLQLADGQTILQELNTTQFINPIRKLLDFNDLGLKQRATEIQYAPDSFPNLPGQISSGIDGLGTNHGALNRIRPNGSLQNIPYDISEIGPVQVTAGSNATDYVTCSSTVGFYPGMPFYFLIRQTQGAATTNAVTLGSTATQLTTYYVSTIISSTEFTFTDTYADALAGGLFNLGADFGGADLATSLFMIPIPKKNRLYNEGFAKRIQYRKMHSKYKSTGIFDYTAIIYLRDLHDLFRQWVFPTTNVRWQARFNLSHPINSTGEINAFMHDGHPALVAANIKVAFTPGTARLYMKQITLTADQNTKLQSRMSQKEGFKKHLVYAETQVVKVAGNFTAASTATITNSITGVKRIILFGVPTTLGGSTGLTSWTAPHNGVVEFNVMELKINNVPLEKYRLGTDKELFQSLKEQTHNAGESNNTDSLISYQTYSRGVNRLYVFDFQRLSVRPNENVPIQIQVSYSSPINTGVPVDLYAILEREAHVDLMVDSNSARIVKDYL